MLVSEAGHGTGRGLCGLLSFLHMLWVKGLLLFICNLQKEETGAEKGHTYKLAASGSLERQGCSQIPHRGPGELLAGPSRHHQVSFRMQKCKTMGDEVKLLGSEAHLTQSHSVWSFLRTDGFTPAGSPTEQQAKVGPQDTGNSRPSSAANERVPHVPFLFRGH